MDQNAIDAINGVANSIAGLNDFGWNYLVSLIVMVLVAGFSAFGGAFIKTRASNAAIAKDIQSIKASQAQLTQSNETIKSQIGKQSEYNTLRIRKLEELMEGVIEFTDHCRRAYSSATPELGVPAEHVQTAVLLRCRALARFYFPELFAEFHGFAVQWEECLLEHHSDLIEWHARFGDEPELGHYSTSEYFPRRTSRTRAEHRGRNLEETLIVRMHDLLGQPIPSSATGLDA